MVALEADLRVRDAESRMADDERFSLLRPRPAGSSGRGVLRGRCGHG